jgi:hypothetical protein
MGRDDELLMRWISGRPQFDWYDHWRNVKAFNFRDILPEDIDWMVKNRPKFMHSTVFTAREVLEQLKRRGDEHILQDTVLWWTNENTAPHEPEVEPYFKEIFQGYGLAELTPVATECPCHRMHVTMEVAVVEEIDGEIVITDPNNFIMPIIRYRTGDSGKIRESECPCGRQLDVLSDLEGKGVDYYWGDDVKGPVGWLTVSPIAKHFTGIIKEWRATVIMKTRTFVLEVVWENRSRVQDIKWYLDWVEEQTGLDCIVVTTDMPFEDKQLLRIVK